MRNRKGIERSEAYVGGLQNIVVPRLQIRPKEVGYHIGIIEWKASKGLSDKGFVELLKLIKKLLPEGNTLPETTYEAKKVVCLLGLEAQKIHACPNDASYIEVSMKIWIHALYAMHAGIRSLEMIQATLRGCMSRRGCLPR